MLQIAFTGALATLCCALSLPAVAEDAASPATQAQVEQWIQDLDSPKFAVRQSASKSLVAAGEIAIEPVKKAAANDSLEVATRAIDILHQLAKSQDVSVEQVALEALDQLVQEKSATAMNLAEATLDRFQHERQGDAIAKLQAEGALVNVVFSQWGDISDIQVTINEGWKGGDDGLAVLRRLPDLKDLSLRQAEITDAAVSHLKNLKGLKTLQIYGTGISDQGAEQLAQALNIKLDRRKGALLGIGGPITGTTGCTVSSVVEGTAAADADIRVGDLVVRFNGAKVESFEHLRQLVDDQRPGETITLDIFRDEKLVTKEVKLGKWR